MADDLFDVFEEQDETEIQSLGASISSKPIKDTKASIKKEPSLAANESSKSHSKRKLDHFCNVARIATEHLD